MRQTLFTALLALASTAPAVAQNHRENRRAERELLDEARELQQRAWTVRQRIDRADRELDMNCTSVHHASAHLQEAIRDRKSIGAVRRQDKYVRQFMDACSEGVFADRRYSDDGTFMNRFEAMEEAFGRYLRAYMAYDGNGDFPDDGDGSLRVKCESHDHKRKECFVPGGIVDVKRADKHSDSSCNENEDWFFDEDKITVRNGCRATFKVFVRDRVDFPAGIDSVIRRRVE